MTKSGLSEEKSPRESAFQKQVILALESVGAYVVKVHVGAYQRSGTPDICACYRGRWISFELKRPGRTTAEPLQAYRIHEILKAGGIARFVNDISEVREVLNEISGLQSCGKSGR